MEELLKYLAESQLRFTSIDEKFVEIDRQIFLYVEPKEGILFDKSFRLMVSNWEKTVNKDFYIFRFGSRYYYTPGDSEDSPQLNMVRYIGKIQEDHLFNVPFLGVHGGYEILNGSGSYINWCKKAKFLGISTLGIAEKNTLAGTLKFQLTCSKEKIRPIIGETISVRSSKDIQFDVKLYPRNPQGWECLLKVNYQINVINQQFIWETDLINLLKEYTSHIYLVLDPKNCKYEDIFVLDLNIESFYQFDFTEFLVEETDKAFLLNLKKFIKSPLQPILIYDAYYLEEEDSIIKERLNLIGSKSESLSEDQYFKSFSEIFSTVSQYFQNEGEFSQKFFQAVENLKSMTHSINFLIPLGSKHLPEYELTEEESVQYGTKGNLFWDLVQKGLSERVVPRFGEVPLHYFERIQEEVQIIEKGDVLDYFLILTDIISWANSNGILTGIGRGSSGGSLIAYLLKITHLDPIELNLLFSRFLNEGRVGKSLPDIDTDFMGSRRDEVKRYMESRYGYTQVCSVGTYTTLQIKAALKDLARLKSLDTQRLNYLTKILRLDDDGVHITGDIAVLFKDVVGSKDLREFVQENPDIVHLIELCLGQPRSQSIHPCATVILPKSLPIETTIPIKKMQLGDGADVLVTEWEGGELEEAGYLKEDILGVAQLDKFASILEKIKKDTGELVDIYSLPLDDSKVYDYFCKGWNGDIFHFGSRTLTEYCKQLQPLCLDDLIAGISLIRPGTMESGFHTKFIKYRQGEEEPEYDYGLYEVTKNTYGLYIYQEQIMQACIELADFTSSEADDIRRALGKMKPELIATYGEEFISRAVKKGCSREEAEGIWIKLARFANYGFNKSHAAAYSITGYIGQWLKVYYPLQFWTTALQYADSSDLPVYISEINKSGSIKLLPPDINKSSLEFFVDISENSIYWNLLSIRNCGEKALSQIEEDRREKGEYFSLEEFISRNVYKGSKTNKLVVENLILSGAFDKLHEIRTPSSRLDLVEYYRRTCGIKPSSTDEISNSRDFWPYDWWWLLKQRQLCGIAFLDYYGLMNSYQDFHESYVDFSLPSELSTYKKDSLVKVAGYIHSVDVRSSKKGLYADILIDCNYEFLTIRIWTDQWKYFSEYCQEVEKSLIFFIGSIGEDNFGNRMIFSHKDSKLMILSSK